MTEIQVAVQSEDKQEVDRIKEIFTALLSSGALTGIKNGKAILYFDSLGIFQGVELDYWVWKRRKSVDNS